jgi:hypothetical protein
MLRTHVNDNGPKDLSDIENLLLVQSGDEYCKKFSAASILNQLDSFFRFCESRAA